MILRSYVVVFGQERGTERGTVAEYRHGEVPSGLLRVIFFHPHSSPSKLPLGC